MVHPGGEQCQGRAEDRKSGRGRDGVETEIMAMFDSAIPEVRFILWTFLVSKLIYSSCLLTGLVSAPCSIKFFMDRD